jgi:N2,N2-dimethylguanosine tRNA methyltransferase
MQEEIAMPLYFSFHGVASALRLTAPKYQEIASALRNAGFATSQCHCDPLALKTNAPGEVVFDVFRAYFRKFQLAEKQEWLEKLPEGFAKQYLSQPATREVTIGSGVHCSTISRWCRS